MPTTTSAGTVSWRAPHEAPAPIGTEAQPATHCRSCKTAEAVTTQGAGLATVPRSRFDDVLLPAY